MNDLTNKGKSKKGLIKKTFERCKSVAGMAKKNYSDGRVHALLRKSKSWPRLPNYEAKNPKQLLKFVPEGCFSIYVGPEKQRFVIKTEYVNHPLFKTLLEEAESEYGYKCEGPLALPCDVEYFVKVLIEMDCDREKILHGCAFAKAHSSSYHLLTPPRFVSMNRLS